MHDQLIPLADSIPVNWRWFQILLLATFLLHVILMNLVLGGSLLSLWDGFRRGRFGAGFPESATNYTNLRRRRVPKMP